MAEVLAQAVGCGGLVHLLCLEYEAQVVYVGLHGKVVHLPQRQLHVLLVGSLYGLHGLVEPYVAVLTQVDEVGVLSGYARLGLVAACGARHCDVELVGRVVLELDAYAPFGYVLLTLVHGGACAVLQHLQAQLGPADERAEGYGYGQAGHARAGYAHAHGVFQNVGAQVHPYAFGHCAQSLPRLSHAEGYGYRLRAAYRRHYLPVDKLDYGLSFFLCKHVSIVFPLRNYVKKCKVMPDFVKKCSSPAVNLSFCRRRGFLPRLTCVVRL